MESLMEIKIEDYLDVLTDYHSNGSYETLRNNVKLLREKNYAVMIRTLNFERNDFSDDLLYVDENAYTFLIGSAIQPNDILMNKIASPGSIYIMPDLHCKVTCGMNLFLIRFNDKVNQRYMYYNMKNSEDRIKKIAHGTSTKTITKDEVRNISLYIHDRFHQDKIENLLTSFDSKIENNNKINFELESLAKTIYDYWFLQFDFPNEEGKPYKSSGGAMEYNEELKMDVPKGWEVKPLGSIIVEQPKSPIQVGQVEGNEGDIPFFTSGDAILRYNNKIVSGRNLFLNTGGKAGLKYYVGDVAYSTDTWCISGIDNLSDYLYLNLAKIEYALDRVYFTGSTGLEHLQKPLLKKRKILVPPSHILDKFNKIVQPMFDMISENTRENHELTDLRDYLLPLLMNGQVGFKDD